MNREITRDAGIIAQEINQIKAEVRDTAIRGAIEIGKRLLEAKSLVPYGSWGKWLEDNVAYSERTAQDLMRIAKEYGRKETQALSEIQNKEQAVLLLALDADERDRFVQEHDMASMSTRQLEEELAQIKAERDKAQLTIEELMTQLGYVEAAPAEMERTEEKADHQQEKMEAVLQEKADLEHSLTEARKQVREAEERRERDIEKKTEELRKAEADRRKAEEISDSMKKELSELRKQAESRDKQFKRMEEELTTAREQVRTVEVVPEAVEQELARLRAQASRSGFETELRAAFEMFKSAYEGLMNRLTEAEAEGGDDAETARKYKGAFHKATLMMAERMK